MIITPHAIVGATLANTFSSDPALGFGISFMSHYILDMLPHTDYDIKRFLDTKSKTIHSIFKSAGSALHFLTIIFDLFFAILLCTLFFIRDEKTAILTLVGIVGGVLPDFLQFLYYKYKVEPWIFIQKIHDKFHFDIETKHNLLLGILVQIFVPILVLLIFFILKR